MSGVWLRQGGDYAVICAKSRHQGPLLAAPRPFCPTCPTCPTCLTCLTCPTSPPVAAKGNRTADRHPRRNLRQTPTPNSVSRHTKRLLAYRAYRAYRAYPPVAAKVPRTTDRHPRRNLRQTPTPNSVSRHTKRLLAYRAYRAYRAYSPAAAKVPRTTDRLPGSGTLPPDRYSRHHLLLGESCGGVSFRLRADCCAKVFRSQKMPSV